MGSLKRTPLFSVYEKHGAKLVEFGGWEMPVQFSGIIDEHNTVRNSAGVFDVSHMGEVYVKGPDAERFIQYITKNNVKKMADKQVQYTFMCYPDGGVVDDLLVYKFSSDLYLLVVNASNIDKDHDWIRQHSSGWDVQIENMSDLMAQLAIQGPLAESILQQLTDFSLSGIKFYYFDKIKINNIEALVSLHWLYGRGWF